MELAMLILSYTFTCLQLGATNAETHFHLARRMDSHGQPPET